MISAHPHKLKVFENVSQGVPNPHILDTKCNGHIFIDPHVVKRTVIDNDIDLALGGDERSHIAQTRFDEVERQP